MIPNAIKEHEQEEKKCKFCNDNKYPFKSNTHLLTNSIMRPAINQVGRANKGRSELYWTVSFGNGSMSSSPFVGRDASIDPLEDMFGEDLAEIADNGQDEFARDDVFCTDCEKKFGTIETLYVEFSNRKITNIEKGDSEKPFESQIIEFGSNYDKALIYYFVMLNVWRYGIFKYDNSDEKNKLEIIRQDLFKNLTNDVDHTKSNLTNTLFEPAFPVFIAYFNTGFKTDTQEEVDLKLTNTFTHSEDMIYFQFGLYTIILQAKQSYFKTRSKPFYGISEKFNISSAVSTKELVKIAILNDDFRDLVSKRFIRNFIIPSTEASFKNAVKHMYTSQGYEFSHQKYSFLWIKFRSIINVKKLSDDDTIRLIAELVARMELGLFGRF